MRRARLIRLLLGACRGARRAARRPRVRAVPGVERRGRRPRRPGGRPRGAFATMGTRERCTRSRDPIERAGVVSRRRALKNALLKSASRVRERARRSARRRVRAHRAGLDVAASPGDGGGGDARVAAADEAGETPGVQRRRAGSATRVSIGNERRYEYFSRSTRSRCRFRR